MNHGLSYTSPASIIAGSFAEAAGLEIIVTTAGARQKEHETRVELTKRNEDILKSITEQILPYIGDTKLLVVTNPVDVMTKVILETSGLPHCRVFGSGTVLDSARFCYELSHRCEVDARNVHGYVIGEHGDSEVSVEPGANRRNGAGIVLPPVWKEMHSRG